MPDTPGRHRAGRKTQATNTDDQPIKLDRWLPYRLFIVAARVAELLADYYTPRFGISQACWRVLAVVGDKSGMSAREIRHAAGLDQFAVSRAIAQLCELGLARRDAASRDKRFAAVELTAAGVRAFTELSALSHRIERELLASISVEEKAALDAMLTRLDNASAGLVARGWRSLMPDVPEPPSK